MPWFQIGDKPQMTHLRAAQAPCSGAAFLAYCFEREGFSKTTSTMPRRNLQRQSDKRRIEFVMRRYYER